MEKAYDRLNRTLILGYCWIWASIVNAWIGLNNVSQHAFTLLSLTMMYVVSLNLLEELDKRTPFPLICFLHVYVEALIRIIWKTISKKKCELGIETALRANKIPSSLFADDYLLFGSTNLESCQELRVVLNNFCLNFVSLLISQMVFIFV